MSRAQNPSDFKCFVYLEAPCSPWAKMRNIG